MHSVTLIPGLSAIADDYDGLISDVWGVLHNGVSGYPAALEALRRFRERGKPVVLITNAPRPSADIAAEIALYGVTPDSYDAIVTSGDVTRAQLVRESRKRAYHVGRDKDLTLIEGLDISLVDEAEADYVLCTSLFDDETEEPEDYRAQFSRFAFRGLTFYCANPDIVVERGHKLVYCAGALAQLYEELGGRVVIVGKPHKPIYDAALDKLADLAGRPLPQKRVLAVGDGLGTDIKGAWGQGLDVLMVTAGIHAADFGGDPERPDLGILAKRLAVEGLAVRAAVVRLGW